MNSKDNNFNKNNSSYTIKGKHSNSTINSIADVFRALFSSKLNISLVILSFLILVTFTVYGIVSINTNPSLAKISQEELNTDNTKTKNLEDVLVVELNNDITSIEELENSQEEDVLENNPNTYYIKINLTAQVVTIYKKDNAGEYTIPVKAMLCSTGTHTPKSGQYTVKSKWLGLRLQGHKQYPYLYGQYVSQITGNILFHSVPYTEGHMENGSWKVNKASLEWEEYDKLGTACSAGCVRLKVSDAKWIFDNVRSGSIVEFYHDSNPGPLGKPIESKISGNVANRNWDPTDPDPNNPWRGGSGISNYNPFAPSTNNNSGSNSNRNTQNNNTNNNSNKNNNNISNTQNTTNTITENTTTVNTETNTENTNSTIENTVSNTITNTTTNTETGNTNSENTTDNNV